ncbi:MAG: helix-turn-helix transcriptional regulator [Geobacteraceae bacterium]|nr:helix-turn-helix transcriptional regulator [Geobacteraceae bacterium]
MGSDQLKSLGRRLKDERIKRNDTQQIFAARLGISVPTLKKMENGNPGVQIGTWLSALRILDRETDIEKLLMPTEDLFARYEQSVEPVRKRASRRNS